MKTRLITSSLLIAVGMFVAGCSMSSKSPAPVVQRIPASKTTEKVPASGNLREYYTVKKGDTLYSISLEHGQDYRDVAAWNNLENVGHITIGQQLRVAPPGGADAVAVASPIVLSGGNEGRPLSGSEATTVGTGANTDQLKREPKAGKMPYSEQAKIAAATPVENKPPETKPVSPEVKSPAETKTEAKPADEKTDSKATDSASTDVKWMWPATGKLLNGFNEGNKGVDIGGKAGDPVLAAADGKVVYSGSGLRGYGKLVIIKHNATFLSAYAHNQDIQVKEGQMVTRGQKIADMGNTDADQVKLHFEIRRQGSPVDPGKYLPSR